VGPSDLSSYLALKVLIRAFVLWVEDFIDLRVLFKVGNKSLLAVIKQNKVLLLELDSISVFSIVINITLCLSVSITITIVNYYKYNYYYYHQVMLGRTSTFIQNCFCAPSE